MRAIISVLFLLSTVLCLNIELEAKPAGSQATCIRDFVAEGQLVVVNIHSSGYLGDGQVLNFNIIDSVGNEYRKKKDVAGSIRVAFTAHSSAAFDICFENIKERHGGVPLVREVELDIESGAAARDWNAIQAAEKLKPVEVELRRLEDIVNEVVDELNYLKVREERLRNTNESTNSRVKNFSLAIVFSLVGFGVWQIQYLRHYFKVKHIL